VRVREREQSLPNEECVGIWKSRAGNQYSGDPGNWLSPKVADHPSRHRRHFHRLRRLRLSSQGLQGVDLDSGPAAKVPADYVRPTITDTVATRLSTISQEILSRTRLEK